MKRLADIFRAGYPQIDTFFKAISDNGDVSFCALGYLVEIWERETGKKFPYRPFYFPEHQVAVCMVTANHPVFENEVLPYFGMSRDVALTIMGMNDRKQTPQEIADYLETVQ